jgi:type I site-specific restriction endonuclease
VAGVNKTYLTETDIITNFILPAVKDAGWDVMSLASTITPAGSGAKKSEHGVQANDTEVASYHRKIEAIFSALGR